MPTTSSATAATTPTRALRRVVPRICLGMASYVTTLFEVPPEADDAFLGAWRGADGVVLHRALRPDVAFRFVSIGAPAPDVPFPARAASYETAHEDGTPDGADGVVFINPLEVP